MANQTFNISLPDGVNAIDNPLAGGDRVTLPFKAPSLYWHNGQAQAAKDASGALFFGGTISPDGFFTTRWRAFGCKAPRHLSTG